MAIMEISVVPLGTGQTGVGEYVARIINYLKQNGIPHTLTDMGTILEGDIDQLLGVARVLHELPFHENVQRVVTHIAIDDRRDRKVHLDDKIKAVSQRLS
ncbi:MAG: MTH1187 family thiamine-binding protein [Deltaproteobacteria bacterium]|nr:MTH1187 family thiamine-binding protein [Deltaproteobacteria bacterium]